MRLKSKPFETWIDMPDGSRFLVRDIPNSKLKEMIARNPNNPIGTVMDAYGYQFKDWQGVCDEHGNALPYNLGNLRDAIENDLEALNEVMNRFKQDVAAHRESLKSAEKN
jgi:hypothetical protein